MCGIFGFAKREGWQSDAQMDRIEDVISNLTFESVVRGDDSTGLAIASPRERLVYKTLKASDELVCSDEWHGILERVDKDTTIFLGHTRLATTGVVTERNVHPFVKGSIIGAHNGIIYNHEDIAKKIDKSVQVDSEVIFGLLNKKEKYQEVFDLLEGDFALSWFGNDYRILNLMHEEGRPLHIAYWKKARCLFWASTENILYQALKDSGLVIDIAKLPVDIIYEFNTAEFWKSYSVSEIEVITNANFTHNKYGYGGYYRGYSSYSPKSTPCIMCAKEVWSTNDICWRCKKDNENTKVPEYKMDASGNWTVVCSVCRKRKRYDEITYIEGFNVCDICDSRENVDDSYGGRDWNWGTCDFCGDWDERTMSKGYNMCIYCLEQDKKANQTCLPTQ